MRRRITDHDERYRLIWERGGRDRYLRIRQAKDSPCYTDRDERQRVSEVLSRAEIFQLCEARLLQSSPRFGKRQHDGDDGGGNGWDDMIRVLDGG